MGERRRYEVPGPEVGFVNLYLLPMMAYLCQQCMSLFIVYYVFPIPTPEADPDYLNLYRYVSQLPWGQKLLKQGFYWWDRTLGPLYARYCGGKRNSSAVSTTGGPSTTTPIVSRDVSGTSVDSEKEKAPPTTTTVSEKPSEPKAPEGFKVVKSLRADEAMYTFINFGLISLISLPSWLVLYHHRVVMEFFLFAMLTLCLWNGASFYVEVFSKRYSESLKHAEELRKLRSEKRKRERAEKAAERTGSRAASSMVLVTGSANPMANAHQEHSNTSLPEADPSGQVSH